MMIHNDLKPFLCTICMKRFREKSFYNFHYKNHLKEQNGSKTKKNTYSFKKFIGCDIVDNKCSNISIIINNNRDNNHINYLEKFQEKNNINNKVINSIEKNKKLKDFNKIGLEKQDFNKNIIFNVNHFPNDFYDNNNDNFYFKAVVDKVNNLLKDSNFEEKDYSVNDQSYDFA